MSAPRARAVADLPVDGLVARSPEIAREWALALIAQLPPGRIGEVPLQALAEQGPAICAQILRALTSESDLDQLTGRGGSRGREQRPAPAGWPRSAVPVTAPAPHWPARRCAESCGSG